MTLEPGYAADGSVAAWLLYRMEEYVGSVCRTKPGRWQLNDADGAVLGIYRTRRAAFDAAAIARLSPRERGE